MSDSNDKDWITSTELMARLEADPAFQERRRIAEEAMEARERLLDKASEPLIRDLSTAGYEVDDVSLLAASGEPYLEALPFLMDHFERGDYPVVIVQGIGRALQVKQSIVFWDRLKQAFIHPRSADHQEQAARVLAHCAPADRMGELMELLQLEEGGDARICLIGKIFKAGGQQGRALVAQYVNHPELGKEATAFVKRAQKKRSVGGK